MQIEQIITHAAPLGEQLSHSVKEQRHSDFALLLSLLSNDATEFSQFQLIKSEKSPTADPLLSYAKVAAGPKKPLASEPFNGLLGEHNRTLLENQGLIAIQFNECLKPEPFTCKNDKNYIPPLVVDNCPPAVQKKLHSAKQVGLKNNEMDVDNFYQSIEKSQEYSFASVA